MFRCASLLPYLLRSVRAPNATAAMSARGRGVDPAGGQPYSAVALSLVFHSGNPHLPTVRADVRRFEVAGVGAWFGGGADLTPFYLQDADAVAFHRHWRDVCGRHGPELYPAYKKWHALYPFRTSARVHSSHLVYQHLCVN